VNALTNPEVGDYLNKHFVSTFQKVGSFQIVNGQKQGGNVASYFCTPKEGVLDAVAGPVDAATLLREARWVVETRKMALLESHEDVNKYKVLMRLAHAEQLPREGTLASVVWPALPLLPPSTADMDALLENSSLVSGLNNQDKVHLALAAYPLPDLAVAYPAIYEKILNEKVSTRPVAEGVSSSGNSSGHSQWLTTSTVSPGSLLSRGLDWGASYSGRPPAMTPEARAELARAQELRHARNNPPATEIQSAKPLNVLLADLEGMHAQGASFREVPLAPEVLEHLNLTPTAGDANFALLKDGGQLRWPMAWHRQPLAAASAEPRKALESSLKEVLALARKGPLDPDRLNGLRGDLEKLQGLLKDKIADVSASTYIEANRYLTQLDDALKVLEHGEATRYVNGAYALDPAKIKTVPDLVAFMAEKGLRFAPAVGGDESAYQALHLALVACDVGQAQPALTPEGSLERGEI
jgi:hypothetical protein